MRTLLFALLLTGCPTTEDKDDTGRLPCDSCDTREQDEDGDGYVASEGDCDDTNPYVNPSATETCNGVDDDCDDTIDEDVQTPVYPDNDADGFGDPDYPMNACEPSTGSVWNGTDCDDANPLVYPSAEELCDSLDNDCDGEIDDGVTSTRFIDADGDGYGDPAQPIDTCEPLEGTVTDDSDCLDTDATAYPGAPETCDGVDDDCDGSIDEDATDAPTWYLDADADGYGGDTYSDTSCDPIDGFASTNDDCDDTSADVSPGGTEVCDGEDQDCDGVADDGLSVTDWYTDDDGDGYGDPSTARSDCASLPGEVADAEDCDDDDADVSPAATETCDTVDQDCDGLRDEGGVCACDVFETGGSVYQLCITEVAWASAVVDCEADGYHLATIDDATEDAALRAETGTYASDLYWWIGYSDIDAEGTWEWLDGSSSTYTNWNSGEPNDLFGEDCATFAYEGDWNDWACTNSTSYLCEAE